MAKQTRKSQSAQHEPHASREVHTALFQALTSLGIRQGLLEAAKWAFGRAVDGVADHDYEYAVCMLEGLAYDATIIREAERAKRRQTALARPQPPTRPGKAPEAGSTADAPVAAPRQANGKMRPYVVWLLGKLRVTVMARNADEALTLAKQQLPSAFESTGSHVKPESDSKPRGGHR